MASKGATAHQKAKTLLPASRALQLGEKAGKLKPVRTLVESDPAGGYIVTLLSTTDLPDQQSLKAHGLTWRLFSASELLLGALIVIGHNVFHVVPDEVPILFVLGLASVRVPRWRMVGVRIQTAGIVASSCLPGPPATGAVAKS